MARWIIALLVALISLFTYFGREARIREEIARRTK